MDCPGLVDISKLDLSIVGSGMTNQRYSPEFKDEAVRQIVDRGYSVAEVSKRLGVYKYSYELLFVAGFPTVN